MATFSDYYGNTRHAPSANVGRPELEQRRPVATFSSPASANDVSGTSDLLNNAGRKKPKGARGSSPLSGAGSILNLDNASDIISESGLGKTSDGRSIGERMSDADAPTQLIGTQADGRGMTHYRVNPSSGNVTATALGAQATGPSYTSLTSYLDGLQ